MDGAQKISSSRVRNVLRSCYLLNDPDAPLEEQRLSNFGVSKWQGEESRYFTTKKRKRYLVRFCQHLHDCAQESASHLSAIDRELSSAFFCQIDPRKVNDSENVIVSKACDLLQRLPRYPLGLPGLPRTLDQDYFYVSGPDQNDVSPSWETLKISSWFSTVVIQTAISVICNASTYPDDCPNELAELLETSCQLAAEATSEVSLHQWYVARAALWSSWQRAVMLVLHSDLCKNLERGFDIQHKSQPHLRGTTPVAGSSIQMFSKLYAAEGKADYMCLWAFELLRREPSCITSDFRTFHSRYRELWGRHATRCDLETRKPCLGNDPDGCRRFKGMVIRDQSAHDSRCLSKSCSKLVWDECSYISTPGAKAVSLRHDNGSLKYCTASEDTLAISHVWSHGQGGRPHDGINQCLHQRYVDVCSRLGCDSYWWDSACIPEDHDLRAEAIRNINMIFAQSKVTLICDKDLMDVDISDLTVESEESILATVLVCDWNLRAWTFLESFRGRHQVYLLCKNQMTISFRELCLDVCHRGSIDLAIFTLTLGHMLPQGVDSEELQEWSTYQVPKLKGNLKASDVQTYIPRHIAGSYLSYRPASRKGDDVVIWGLLTSDIKFDSAEDFWLSRVFWSDSVPTGFLMSSAPRANAKGLSWAPSTPYFKSTSQPLRPEDVALRAYSGVGTSPGFITDAGFISDWLVYEFDVTEERIFRESVPSTSQDIEVNALDEVIRTIKSLYLQHDMWGALLRTRRNFSTFEQDADISLNYEGLLSGTLVAVLGSRTPTRPSLLAAQHRGWKWKGSYVWEDHIRLPQFEECREFLIE